MISPINYDYNKTIYPHIRTNSNYSSAQPVSRVSPVKPVNVSGTVYIEKPQAAECQTCNSRKYIDGSNEGNVSFKTPTHISPEASRAVVSSHEKEHVSNAVSEGSKPGKELVFSSVRLEMDVCPECGKTYIAGGETITQMKYNVGNPYEKSRKSVEESLLKGMNFDAVA
jgi:ferredoxin-like protein FixX